MSHNTLLIDGLGQAQQDRYLGQELPIFGRMVGFSRGEDYVYFAGDATNCYPKGPMTKSRRFSTGNKIPEVYRKRGLPYLNHFVRHILFLRNKYFIVFDDLKSSQPATYTWLYHILPDQPLEFNEKTFAIDYKVGNVKVRLQQIADIGNLRLENRKGLEGHINPITGEDYRQYYKNDLLCGHNLWISNKEPTKQRNFLTVIYPEPPGGKIPAIKRLDDFSVKVGDDVISFDPKSKYARKADILVDISAFR